MNPYLLIPLLPLLGFALNGTIGPRMPGRVVSWVSCGSLLVSFALSVKLFLELSAGQESVTVHAFSWIHAGSLHIDLSFLLDPLSSVMLLVVTGVGFLIHVYSIGYMKADEAYPRFMAYMNLFVFFMLLLVMGDNFVVMFAGWEGVGLCSFLLIGFWFRNHEFNEAARKAFVMNRIGDLGFLLGMFLIYRQFGSLDYQTVFESARLMPAGDPALVGIALLLFVGAIGKSAQIPLHTWLPDAMAGPTPVSALIHAATMVTAGVYMIVRSNVIYTLAEPAATAVLAIGLATALLAATIALRQNDIKKVLAYSTISQLGFMFVAAGMGAYTAAVFHLVTHAFFKALLFLGAGSVIHGLDGEQDIRQMGGLRRHMPRTHATFLVGTLSISGIPPLAGFFSKDEILAMGWSHAAMVFVALAFASVLTAVYMFRLYWLTFHGAYRGDKHAHESPSVMTLPLVVLALLAAVGGFIGAPSYLHLPHGLKSFLEPVIAMPAAHVVSHSFEYALAGISVIVLVAVIFITRYMYVTRSRIPLEPGEERGLGRILSRKYFIDELYHSMITAPLRGLSALFAVFDRYILDAVVNAIPRIIRSASGRLRLIQQGNIGVYVLGTAAGVVFLLIVSMLL